MDLKPLSIRVADVIAVTRFADHQIRKPIKSGDLGAVKTGRLVLIKYSHFEVFLRAASAQRNQIAEGHKSAQAELEPSRELMDADAQLRIDSSS